jgi:hypothetical protein
LIAYGNKDYRFWDKEGSKKDLYEAHDVSLLVAIHQNPPRASSALAGALGLDFFKIQNFRSSFDNYLLTKPTILGKRNAEDNSDQEVPPSWQKRHPALRSPARSSSSSGQMVGWATRSYQDVQNRVLVDRRSLDPLSSDDKKATLLQDIPIEEEYEEKSTDPFSNVDNE